MALEFVDLNRLFQTAEIRYLNLKGLLLAPDFAASAGIRVQYDYDFLIKKDDLQRACHLLLELGYSPLHSNKEVAADHLPTLIRRTGWQWEGNYFDPAIPRGIELHFQLWDADFELLPVGSFDNVWERACFQQFGSINVPTLSREDTLLYVTLHALRHLLRNDLRLSHLYELAFFIQKSFHEEIFWDGFLARSSTVLTPPRWSLRRSSWRGVCSILPSVKPLANLSIVICLLRLSRG